MLTEVTLDDDDLLGEVADMHMELLEFGPMAGMGRRFVQETCYRSLLRTGILKLFIYEVEGESAGFVGYTHRSKQFHELGIKNSFFSVVFETLRALITKPTRVRALLASLRVLNTRRHEPDKPAESDGEVICLAVRPQYLTGKFVRATNLRLSEELVLHSARELLPLGIEEMRMIVDEDNKAVLFLYHRLGARFEPFQLGDRPSIIAIFSVRELLEKFDHKAECA